MNRYFEKLFKGSAKSFFDLLEENLLNNKKSFVVTANPETFIIAKEDESFEKLILDENVTVVADGIGIVKASKIAQMPVTERIPGIEVAKFLLECANKHSLRVFLFGAEEEILEKLCDKLRQNLPSIQIVGKINGYTDNKDEAFLSIKNTDADIILVALGIPAQEKLIYKHFDSFNKGVFVGVGGSFDVLSGQKNRAPQFFLDHNIEWLYRIFKEPKRLKRFYNNNIKFIINLKKYL